MPVAEMQVEEMRPDDLDDLEAEWPEALRAIRELDAGGFEFGEMTVAEVMSQVPLYID